MTLLNKITDAINVSPEDDKLYLIEKISDIAGLFVSNKKFIYMAKNVDDISSSSMQTEYLRLQANVNVISIENSQNFDSGFYNLIEYRLPYTENILAFEAFINLCLAHIRLMHSKDFVDFFNSLVDLFKNETEEKKQNVYGLFGELSLIYYYYTTHKINLVPYWHTSGSYSKYDFSINQKNIEVKTSNSIKNILIKHSQIFNADQNYLAIVLVEDNNAGITLKELEDKLKAIESINSNFNFVLNLETENAGIKMSDFFNKKLKLINVQVYNCKEITPFYDLPENISNLEYRMDLMNCCVLPNERIKDFLIINC